MLGRKIPNGKWRLCYGGPFFVSFCLSENTQWEVATRSCIFPRNQADSFRVGKYPMGSGDRGGGRRVPPLSRGSENTQWEVATEAGVVECHPFRGGRKIPNGKWRQMLSIFLRLAPFFCRKIPNGKWRRYDAVFNIVSPRHASRKIPNGKWRLV